MAKKYRSMQQYSKKIYELHNQGLTHREVGEKIGLSYKQVKKFFEREHRKERALAAGKALHKRGRPKNQNSEIPPSIQQLDKLAQMRYVLASKERYIKRLEMELELMQDFLSLTERK